MNVATQDALPRVINLNLTIREPDIISELSKYPDGKDQQDFALSALRIGVLALRQANGLVDASAVKAEGERLVETLRDLLTTNSKLFLGDIASTLKSYFDPGEGHLPQRLDRLIKKDGELQSLLSHHLDGEESVIARTLGKHIGNESPLLRLFSPDDKQGVVVALSTTVEGALQKQREQVLKQFSLDDKESALSRLVAELTGANGQLRQDLASDVQKLQQEFSLDNEQGALSRLVGRVEKAQRTISDEFSMDNKESALCKLVKLMETANSSIHENLTLDNENSPLSRLRRELTDIIKRVESSSTEFHEEVKLTLESFKVRREESARSTRHGEEFEEAVGAVLQDLAQKAGDILECTGDKPGVIPRCKIGDHVICVGPDSAAQGARIAVEAKENANYDLISALEECETARKNRAAQVGIFVFSSKIAPAGLAPFARHGNDLTVVWNPNDPLSDIYLQAAVSVAKALLVRERRAEEKNKDLDAVKAAIVTITKEIQSLAQISTWAQTVTRSGEKIRKKAVNINKKIVKRLFVLERHLLPRFTESESDVAIQFGS